MAKITKRGKFIRSEVDHDHIYGLDSAVDLLKSVKKTGFDETVEVVIKLGVDPRKADQMVRGTCVFPNGLGKDVSVLAFAKGEKAMEAENAGADYVGAEELAKKIQDGWIDFDRVVATPDMMAVVGKIGKILGPRGLMPNPKVGTVTLNIGTTVKMIKAGQVEFRVDKSGNVHVPAGKISFEREKIVENVSSFVESVLKMKPSTSKGIYMQALYISSTMGPGIKFSL